MMHIEIKYTREFKYYNVPIRSDIYMCVCVICVCLFESHFYNNSTVQCSHAQCKLIELKVLTCVCIPTAKLCKPLLHKLTSNRIVLHKFHYTDKYPVRSIRAYSVQYIQTYTFGTALNRPNPWHSGFPINFPRLSYTSVP